MKHKQQQMEAQLEDEPKHKETDGHEAAAYHGELYYYR